MSPPVRQPSSGGLTNSPVFQPPPVGHIAPTSRLLIIRPSALGDVCRSVGLLASLRRAYPLATIDWLVQDTFAPAIDEHPAFRASTANSAPVGGGKVIAFARHTMQRWYTRRGARAFLSLLSQLRARQYNIVLDAQGLLRSSLFSWLSNAPIRVGLAEAREGATSLYNYLVQLPSASTPRHTVDRMHYLLAALAIDDDPHQRDLQLYASANRRASALAKLNLPADFASSPGFITLAPSSRWPAKQWPPERYAAVAAALHDRFHLPIICVGSLSERPSCEPLFAHTAQHPWLIDAFGKTSVADLMGLIAQSQLVIGSDSAAIHMAVGFSIPCVALYGPTDIRKVGPAIWPGCNRRVITLQHVQPDETFDHKTLEPGRSMMARITTQEVIAAAASLISQS